MVVIPSRPTSKKTTKMKITKLISIAFLFYNFILNAQISTTNSKISDKDVVIKTVKVFDCKSKVDMGSTLKTETIKKGKDKTYTITTEKVIKDKDSSILIEKEIKIRMKNFSGRASLFTKEKEPGRLFIDFWLNSLKTIPSGVNIKEITRTLKCPVDSKNIVVSDYEETTKMRKTEERESKYLFRVESGQYSKWRNPDKDTNVPDWFIHTDLIIEVYMSNGNIGYVLVDKYDRDVIYELEIKNREVYTTIDKTTEFSPLTLPLKLRYGFTKNNIKVNDDFLADANLGAYAGFRIKKFSSRKEQEKLISLPEVSLKFGPFLSLATISVDKSNSTVGTTPITSDETKSIGTLSYGVGIIVNIRNFNVGVFQGWESGFGSSAKNWNYNNRPFLGIGLGYNLDNFEK